MHEINSEVPGQEGRPLLELSEAALDSIVTPEAFSLNSSSTVPFLFPNKLDSHQATSPSISGFQETLPVPTSQPQPAHLVQLSEVSCKRKCTRTPKLKWLPVPTDKLPEPALHLDAVANYFKDHSKINIPKVKGHILSLGWKFEFAKDTHADRLRFTSPEGIPYYSLREVCRMLMSKSEVQFPKPNHEQGSLSLNCNSDVQSFLLVTPPTPRCPSLQDQYISSPKGSFSKTANRIPNLEWQPMAPDKLPEPEFHPDAVTNYCESPSKMKKRESLLPKVKSHILYLGWKFEFAKNSYHARLRFISPEGIIYHSLREVCRIIKPKFVMPEDGTRSLSLCPEKDRQSFQQITKSNTTSPSLPDGPISSPERKVKKSYTRYSKCNLEAVTDYINSLKAAAPKTKLHLAEKAMEHLAADGWDLDFIFKRSKIGKGRRERRYYSPDGKIFCSLVTACVWYKKNIESVSDAGNSFEKRRVVNVRHGLKGQLVDKILHRKHSASQAKVKYLGIRTAKKRKNAVTGIASQRTKRHKVDALELDHGQESRSFFQLAESASACSKTRMLRSSKRIRLGVSPSHHTPRNVLSLLIENNVILPRQKVHCQGIDGRSVAEGLATCYGIECCCCPCIFSISKFVVHAGINCHRPAAKIFLEDRRSMWDCQLQLMKDKKSLSSRTEPLKLKGNGNTWKNDYICSVCHYGGNLLLCDHCPSSFHMDCLGLKRLPEGDWFCPSCCCGICGKRSFDRNTEHITSSSGRSCSQCDRWHHVGCLQAKGFVDTKSNLVGEWFCNVDCEKIFQGLHQHLGKPIAVGNDSLTWTLVKHREQDANHFDINNESSIETYSKLTVALDVIHECFEPLKERLTHRDIVEDVIFCKWSDLNRLNFHGFYTVLLEKDDELVSVATIRVHGKKVAEVPLIATRFQYRRHGLCRILMNELEKVLVQLGVERLVLPAAPSVISTWITSFGFSKMKRSERLNFLDYTFLNFQGTVMCQKVLKETYSSNLSPVEGHINQSFINLDTNGEMDLDGNSPVSEVYQTDRVEDSELVDHGCTVAEGVGNSSENISSPAEPKQPENNLVEVSDHKAVEDDNNAGMICYKRRKLSASRDASTIKIGH
ncbi:hypothetical protein Leryth_021989 [Lithospermum erythrorhizon]|nr:hypothetical protein Leryth_021989 [Lithospermum erythrorhizon]